jgi:hypothetical protein
MLFKLYPASIRLTGLLLLAILGACAGSKKEDVAPTVPPGLSWTVDGRAVSTTSYQLQTSSNTYDLSGTLNQGSNTSSRVFLAIPKSVGTHTFGPNSPALGIYSTSGANVAVYYAGVTASGGTVTGAGTIVVTSLTSNSLVGTYTFTGIDASSGLSKSVSNGTFNVRL